MLKRRLATACAIALGTVSAAAFAGGGSTTLGGKMFADFTNIHQTQDGSATDSSGYGLDVKRFYFTVDHAFDDVWTVNLTTDFNYAGSDGETQVFVKKAYVQAKFSDAAVFRAGSADMPWIPFVENVYGYRFVEQTVTDRLHFANSADWGLHLGGKFAGPLQYQVALVNGGGYKNPSRSSGMDVAGRISLQTDNGVVLALGSYSGHRGQDSQAMPAIHTATRYDALAALVRPGFRIGAEYFRADNWNDVTTATTHSANGYSVFGSVAVNEATSLFARYDNVRLSNDLDPSLSDRYYNAGIAFAARKDVEFAFAYKHENQGDNLHQLKSSEIGIWMQVVF